MKDCGSFRRQKDGVYWTVKERVAMPTEEELQTMITPEEVWEREERGERRGRKEWKGLFSGLNYILWSIKKEKDD